MAASGRRIRPYKRWKSKVPGEPGVSVVIPAYNEEKRLPETMERLFGYIEDRQLSDLEIIIVDDGSTDNTREIISAAQQEYPILRLIENPHSGKSYTIRTGLLAARGPYAIHADADFSTPPEEFFKLLEPLESGYDVAIGVRHGRPGAPFYRKLISRGWRMLVALLVVRGFRDTQCGFKAYRTATARHILKHTRLYSSPEDSLRSARVTAAADVEMLFIAHILGYRVQQVTLGWHHAGDTKMNPYRDSLKAFFDLFIIRWNYLRGRYPRR